jgi:DNA-binding SARP family transcriptional activator/tetratricopeptide (TPR) repeat protein
MGVLMEFGILGPTELIVNGKTVPLGPAKQRGMLAVLLYHVGEPVRADAIIELLWRPRGTADHRPTLYSLASRLRGVLAEAGLAKALVRVSGIGAYRLDVDPAIIDLHRFRQLLTEARRANERGASESAAAILVRAFTLQRGDPLAELQGPYAEELRGRANETLLEAHKLLAESRLAAGHHQSVLAQLERVMRDHELDEALARSWTSALRGCGRHDEARRFTVAFRRRFRKEMHADPAIDVAAPADRPIAEVVPRRLPPDIADFTGRRLLLDELDGLRGPGHPVNVVVITGMPGVGKTTLATHWAHRQRQHFPGGQLYLDAGAYGQMAPVDPNDALDQFLRTLGAPADQLPATTEQRRDRFDDLLGDRRMLILIDNVLDSAQVRPLIPRSMNCLTVITSRTRLSGLSIRDGVRTVTAPPLSEAESTQLLARIVGPRAGPETSDLARLARLSGGLPLAVRIIGEHVAERPRAGIGELAGELRERLLDAADVAADDQAANLTTVFTWSYRVLRGDAARLFRRVSLHPGTSISVEAAAVVLGAPGADTEGLLNALAKAHMINHDTARRYRFHDLLRRYASERAAVEDEPAETARAERRLLDWYLLSAANAVAVVAPEWPAMPDLPEPVEIRPKSFPTEADAMKWCDAERDNLRAVSLWAGHRGYHRHGWQIPGVVHEMLYRYGTPGDLLKLNQQAWEAARRDGHEVGQIGTLVNLGTTYFALRDYDRAIASFTTAHRLAATTGRVEEATICSHNLAAAYLSLGEVTQAVGIYEDLLRVCREIANPAGEAAVLHWLGRAYLRQGRHQDAAEVLHQSLAIRERIGAKRGMGQSHSGLGALYLASGRFRMALRHCEIALAMHVRAGDQAAQCDTLMTLSAVRRALGLSAEAVRNGEEAVCLSEAMADSYRQVEALTVLGEALFAAGEPASGDHRIRLAWHILDELSGVHVGPLRERLMAVEGSAERASRAG